MKNRLATGREKSGLAVHGKPGLLMLLVCLLGLGLYAQEAVRPRPPITPEELALTDLPELPGAPAVCLYHEIIDDKDKGERAVFRRIKVLTPAGRDYANLEILYYAFLHEVKDIKVTVYDQEGRSREVKPNIMEKIASKLGESEYRVKTLAVPDISPGQIIDYEYRIKPRENAFGSIDFLNNVIVIRLTSILGSMSDIMSSLAADWTLQDTIYIRKARFRLVTNPYAGFSTRGKYNLAWVANQLRNVKPTIDDKGLELELTDIPPFYKEEFMPPESNEKMTFKVYYLDPEIINSSTYWEKASAFWKKGYEEFMSDEKTLQKELKVLTGTETDPEAKLKKIYERVQNIKNLDYVTDMSEKEWRKITENKKVGDVLKNNYGLKNQIAKTFAALARAAGFETYLVRVVSRDDKLFNPNLPLFYNQFDAEIVMVRIGSRFQAFDPGLPDCPYGVVYWPRTGTAALTFENDQMKIFTSPVSSAEDSTTRQKARLRLEANGDLTGTIQVDYSGQEALSRKLADRNRDELKTKKDLEEELLKKLPAGSKVTIKNLTGLKEKSSQLAAEFEVTIAGAGHQSGDKLLLSVNPLTNSSRYPFRSAFRRYPIYFNYPYTELDELEVELPEGYELEAWPEARTRDSERAVFSLACSQTEPGQLRIERRLAVKKSVFPAADYIHLKEFFDFVQARDGQQIILRKK